MYSLLWFTESYNISISVNDCQTFVSSQGLFFGYQNTKLYVQVLESSEDSLLWFSVSYNMSIE